MGSTMYIELFNKNKLIEGTNNGAINQEPFPQRESITVMFKHLIQYQLCGEAAQANRLVLVVIIEQCGLYFHV